MKKELKLGRKKYYSSFDLKFLEELVMVVKGLSGKETPEVVKLPVKDIVIPTGTIIMSGGVLEKVLPTTLSASVYATITRRYYDGKALTKEEAEELPIEVRDYTGKSLAKVSHSVSMTLNLGNYESVKVGVSVELPSTVEELGEAFKVAKAFVDAKLNIEVQEIKEYRKSRGVSIE